MKAILILHKYRNTYNTPYQSLFFTKARVGHEFTSHINIHRHEPVEQ